MNRDINQVIRSVRNMESSVKREVKLAMEDVLLDLQRRAIERAPVDTGNLRGSSSIEVVEKSGEISGVIGFNTPYALRQHEDLTLNHPNGGEAKYIENPLKENEARYQRYIDDAVKRGVG